LTGPSAFLVQGLVDNFTQNRTGASLVVYPVFILSSVPQQLATFYKILFAKSSFSGTKCTKIDFVVGQGSVPDTAGGATTLPQTS